MDRVKRLISIFRGVKPAGVAGVEELARVLERSALELRVFEPGYRTVTIPKRAGGTRTLQAPDRGTRDLQRLIARRVIGGRPSHPAVYGFEPGRSSVQHAQLHAGRVVVLRMDIEEFFRSTTAIRIRRWFRFVWNDEAADILVRLTTFDGGLPQGAPTSPGLSSRVNARLDARLAGFARSRRARYSRYADDITYSLATDDGKVVHELIRFTEKALASEGYRMHRRRKLHVRRQHERQLVAGLVVNQQPRLPRERRRWLRAVEHRRLAGLATTLTDQQLAGWRAYRSMVERGAALPPADADLRVS
jgi:RNA-directed DNA polymerase